VPGSAWKLFDCLVSPNRLAHPDMLSQISWGNRYFSPECRWAGLCQESILRQPPSRPLRLIVPGRRAPVAPVCHEHSSPLIWFDNTHHRTAELKGKALVLADQATIGTMTSQHLAQCECLHPCPRVTCLATALSSTLRLYTSIPRRPARTPCLPRDAGRFLALKPR
jgi:hypothetical protein